MLLNRFESRHLPAAGTKKIGNRFRNVASTDPGQHVIVVEHPVVGKVGVEGVEALAAAVQ